MLRHGDEKHRWLKHSSGARDRTGMTPRRGKNCAPLLAAQDTSDLAGFGRMAALFQDH